MIKLFILTIIILIITIIIAIYDLRITIRKGTLIISYEKYGIINIIMINKNGIERY